MDKKIKKNHYEIVDSSIENLTPNSIVFFVYDLENDENPEKNLLKEKIENLNSNLNNIFSLNNEIKEENWKIILTWINDIKISFSRKKSDKFGWKFFITEIIIENLNVDINKEEKYFLQTFYYILKNLEWLNINYIDDSFTDVLNENNVDWNNKCSIWEICSFIQTFKEKFLEKDLETPKYLELIKILSKENFETKELEDLLNDEIFINEKIEILEKIKNDKENSRKKIFNKYKEKIIAKEFQNVLNFYLEIRKIIIKRAWDFQSDLDKNIFWEIWDDLLLEHFLWKDIKDEKTKDIIVKTEKIVENSNEQKENAIKVYDSFTDNMISWAIDALKKLELQLINFHQNLEENFSKLESQEENFSEKNLNLSEKIILETEKQIKKIPDLFQKVSFIISKIPNILWNKKEKKETNNEKEKREIEEFYDIALKILAEKNFLEQKNDENLEKKLNTKIKFLKQKYKNNEIIQSIKYFPLEKILVNIYSYKYARNANVNYHINYHKKNKNSSFVFQFWNEKLNNELWKLSEEKPEVNKYLIQSKIFEWHNWWANYVSYKNFSDFWNNNDIREFFDKYDEFKKLAFFKKYNFLYNENEEKYYKLIYLKESFICEDNQKSIEFWYEKDDNIEMRIKDFFNFLVHKNIIKNIIKKNNNKENANILFDDWIDFEIELNSWDILEIKLIDNSILVLWANTEKISSLEELEKFFIEWETQTLYEYTDFVIYSVNNILTKRLKNVNNKNSIILNFSKDFSAISNQINTYNSIIRKDWIDRFNSEQKNWEYLNWFSIPNYRRETPLWILQNYSSEMLKNWKMKIIKHYYSDIATISETAPEELVFNSYFWIFSLWKYNSDIINFQITQNKDELYKTFQRPVFKKVYVKIEDDNYVKLQITNSYEIVKYLLDIDYERLKNWEKPLYEEFYDLKKVYFLQNVSKVNKNSDKKTQKNESDNMKKNYQKFFLEFKKSLLEEIKKRDFENIDDFLQEEFKKIFYNDNNEINLFEAFYVNLLYNNLYEIFRITFLGEKKYVDLDKFNDFFLKNLNSVLEPVNTKYQYIDKHFWKIKK